MVEPVFLVCVLCVLSSTCSKLQDTENEVVWSGDRQIPRFHL